MSHHSPSRAESFRPGHGGAHDEGVDQLDGPYLLPGQARDVRHIPGVLARQDRPQALHQGEWRADHAVMRKLGIGADGVPFDVEMLRELAHRRPQRMFRRHLAVVRIALGHLVAQQEHRRGVRPVLQPVECGSSPPAEDTGLVVLDQLGPGTGDDAVGVRPGVDLRPRTRALSTATATVGTSAMSGTFTATSTFGTSVAPGTSVSNALEHHPTGKGVVSPVDGPPAHPGGFEPFPPLRKMRRQDTRDVPGSSARRVPAFGQGSGDVRRQLPRRVRRCALPGNGLACAGLALRTLSCQGLGPLPAPRPPRSAAVITPHHRPFSCSFRKTCQIRGMNRRYPAE